MATATATASPASPAQRSRGLRLIGFSLIGVVVYAILLYVVTGSTGTALQQTANALTIGSIYALVALGYTMVYGIIELINFAHGDVFMIGAFLSVVFVGGILGQVAGRAVTDILPLALMLVGALVFVMPLTGLLNMGIERVFYRPLRNAPRLAPLITAIGVSFILQNLALIVAGSGDRAHPQIFPINDDAWRIHLGGGASIAYLSVFIFIVAIGLLVALQQFVGRTRLGRAMRSTAQDPQAAALMGVDLNQTIALTFLLGGAMAGAAGVVWGLQFGYVRFDLGLNAGLKAFTAAVLGGIGNVTGAVLGGFMIGFLEVFATTIGQTRWSQFLVFVVLAVVLVFRPAGLLGQQLGERA
jgi:branched-chain amino acid transport system permease protein